MKKLILTSALLAALAASANAMPIARNYTPVPNVQKAMCAAYQVCQTCYRQDGTAYQCNCHMECMPGTEDHGGYGGFGSQPR